AVQGIFIFAMVALFLTLFIFFGRICFGWFKSFSPISYKHMHRDAEPSEDTLPQSGADLKPFIPNVLMDERDADMTFPTESPPMPPPPANPPQSTASSYGAVDSDNVIIPNGSPSQGYTQ
ncbi:hypothetical protein CAPTEDRAFT_185845, partial [Capitella teleta]